MKQILKNTWAILDKKERKRFSLLITLGILISLADILFLALLLWIIKFYIQPGETTGPSFLPGWLADKNSAWMIGIFFFLFGIKNAAAYFISKLNYDFTSRVAIRISRINLLSFQQGTYTDYVMTDSSALIRKIALQPFEFSQHVLAGMQQIITQLFLIAIAIIAILLFKAKLFLLLLLILLPPVAAVFGYIKKRTATIKKDLRDSNERSYQYLYDTLKGYVEANIFQRNDFFLQRFIRQRRRFSTRLFESLLLQTMPGRIIEIFAVLGLFILIIIAKYSGVDDSNTLITIGAFMAAAYKIIPGIVKVINLIGQVKAFEFSPGELVTAVHEEKNENKNSPAIRSLEFKLVAFHYPGQKILHDLSFSIQKGDFLGISGVSGKGKTTLLNLLLGFLSPASGEIRINGQVIPANDLEQYRYSISYVKQQSFFIYDTLLRNITLEEKDHDQFKLDLALKASGLDRMAEIFPEGLEKMITENGKNISGGQQQRVAIARGLYKDADLFLLDEPFNELDEGSTLSILQHLRELAAKGKMIILITHDKMSLTHCNKIVSLDEQG